MSGQKRTRSASTSSNDEGARRPCPGTTRLSGHVDFEHDTDGDLIVIAGREIIRPQNKPLTFRVCSRSMARSSPVWKALLFGGYAESRPLDGRPWIVEFPEDNAQAMHVVLSIIHGRFNQVYEVPAKEWAAIGRNWRYFDPDLSLDLQGLYEITILTEKYDLSSYLRPWARQWSRHFVTQRCSFVRRLCHLSPYPSECDCVGCLHFDQNAFEGDSNILHQELWITWELRDLEGFEKIFSRAAFKSQVSSNDTLLPDDIAANSRQDFLFCITHLGLSKALAAARLEITRSFLDDARFNLEHYIDPPPELLNEMGQRLINEELGSHIRGLRRKNIWPLPKASEVLCSPRKLQDRLLLAFGAPDDTDNGSNNHLQRYLTCALRGSLVNWRTFLNPLNPEQLNYFRGGTRPNSRSHLLSRTDGPTAGT
ncbi:hypothetical protein F4780DRAFT_728416 [Xylariomycetidae sp. FL0641]|nr:hypothetical protein F4780DRAFT_728416 [Xylariomycetidae sp. FL0641]